MSYTYVEDWDEEARGPFPVRSRRFAGCREVVLDGPHGRHAGFCTREPSDIGKVCDDGEDTRRTLPAKYTPISLFEPSAERKAKLAARMAKAADRQVKGQQKKNALEAIRSKRENGQPLDAEDIGFIADVLTGRLDP